MKLPVSFPALELSPSQENMRTIFTGIIQMFQRIANAVNNPDNGATAGRPTFQLTVGQTYFDATLDKPIWWNGTNWKDATGTTV